MGMVLIEPRGPGRTDRPAGERGFSLVEVLIATFLFLMIVLGLAPLFARAALSNASGADSTQISQFARSRAEDLIQAPFNSGLLIVNGGGNDPDLPNTQQLPEFWNNTNERFEVGVPVAGSFPRWLRTTRVRQFGINSLEDGQLADNEALNGAAPPEFVQLKEVEVTVESNVNLLLGGRTIVVRTLKSF